MRDEEVIEYANRVFKMQQARYREIGCRSINERKQDLKRLLKVVLSHREEIASAVAKDLNKPAFESDFSEVYPVVSELRHAIKHLHRWASTRKVPAPVAMIGTKAWMKPEAKGQALVAQPEAARDISGRTILGDLFFYCINLQDHFLFFLHLTSAPLA